MPQIPILRWYGFTGIFRGRVIYNSGSDINTDINCKNNFTISGCRSPSLGHFYPATTIYINIWKEADLHIHHNQRKEALLKKSVVCLLTCAFSAIMISELSSAIIIQSHSKKIQITEEDIPESGIKTLKNWFHRQIDFGSFQPINDTYFPRTFKKTVFSTQSPIQL